jgi:hypothetical protein
MYVSLYAYFQRNRVVPNPCSLFLSARTDRYNHSLESDDDEDQAALDFSSFSTCSPRYSRICNSPSPLASSPVSPVGQEMFHDLKSSEKTIRRTYSEGSNSPPTVRRRSKTESHNSGFRERYSRIICRCVRKTILRNHQFADERFSLKSVIRLQLVK